MANIDFPLMTYFKVTAQISSYTRNSKPWLMTSSEDDDELVDLMGLLTASIQRMKSSELVLQFGSSKWSWSNERGMLELQNFSFKEATTNWRELKLINRFNVKYKHESSKVLEKELCHWWGTYLCNKPSQKTLPGLEDKWHSLVTATQVTFTKHQTRPATSHPPTSNDLQLKSLAPHSCPHSGDW